MYSLVGSTACTCTYTQFNWLFFCFDTERSLLSGMVQLSISGGTYLHACTQPRTQDFRKQTKLLCTLHNAWVQGYIVPGL